MVCVKCDSCGKDLNSSINSENTYSCTHVFGDKRKINITINISNKDPLQNAIERVDLCVDCLYNILKN